MFYSHQLLARKAPLGQIWMAATLNSKIKRSNLEKLNIPRICEEILNPSIPMALRLSGILMGGVVNVFKRKVDFLYDDVNRFLEDLNRVFKAKFVGDSGGKTQAKGKAHARSNRAITIEDKDNIEVDLDQYFIPSIPSFDVGKFRNMTIEDLDDNYINIQVDNNDHSIHHQHHQADPDDITLPDKVDLGTIHTGSYDHFERFDIGDETFTQTEFMSQVLPDSRQTPMSPPPPHAPDNDVAMKEKKREAEKQLPKEDQPEVLKSTKEEPGICRPLKRKPRGNYNKVIIDKQTMIPNETYHSWLNNVSDISSLRRRKTKPATNILRMTKIENIMNLPPLCLMPSSSNFLHEIHYPELLMELWWKPTMGNPQTPISNNNKASLSFPGKVHHGFSELQEQDEYDFEKRRTAYEGFSSAPGGDPVGFTSSDSHGEASRAIYSSETVPYPSTSGRSNKRQNFSVGNLDTVAEDFVMNEIEPLEETGPSPIPYHKVVESLVDKVTESIRKQLKLHFDTPGNSQAESLNHLADGLTRKKASILFYHTCVMATLDYVKVEQLVPYGDISISKGPKM